MSERRFGILIGSSQFPDEPKLETLRFPENDVDGLNEILTSQNHGQFTQIFVLKNKLHHEILLKINQILREANKQDLVLIYYSGHGKLNPAGRLHLATANTSIGALEATSISVATLKEYVDISSSNKIILILDCCFSGAAGLEFAKGSVDDQLQLISGGRGTYIMTASTGIQVAQEKESDKYGVFTKHVIQGISSGDADLDSDGHITMGELYHYVHDHVLDEGFQEPMKWDLNVRGELVIARSGKTPLAERRKKILKMLYNLAADGILPDDILDKARQVIALAPDRFSEEDRTYDRLIDQLLKKRLEPVEFIRKWDKVRPEKPPLKHKPSETKREKPESIKVKPPATKPDATATTELKSPVPRKTSDALKFAAVAGVIVLLMLGVWWYFSGFQTKKQLIAEQTDKSKTPVEKPKIETPEPPSPQKVITNSIGMKFMLIPAGNFDMGSPPDEAGREDDEKQHEVIISKPFYLQTTEVSQGQWKKVMGNNPSHFKGCGDDCPVEQVSWDDAQKFISKLNQMESTNKYRLPTEAEWEYAFRAGTTTVFSFGNEVDKLGEYAWYSANSESQTHPGGKKKPNAWGLYDMHGNVWEWCQDWYGDYPPGPITDPKGPDNGKYRVLRGGSWGSIARSLRSAFRGRNNPDYRSDYGGFRVARDF